MINVARLFSKYLYKTIKDKEHAGNNTTTYLPQNKICIHGISFELKLAWQQQLVVHFSK